MQKKFSSIVMLLALFAILTACGQLADESFHHEQPIAGMENESEVDGIRKETIQLSNVHSEFKRIYEKGKLTVAMYSEDRFPYFFLNEYGELIGSDVDLVYDIAYQLGIKKVEFDRSSKTYDELIDLVAKNEVDLAVSKISITLNRAQRVLFSEPYFTLKQAILLNRVEYAKLKTKQSEDPVQLLKSNQVKIGALAGTSYMEFAKQLFLSAEMIPFITKEQMLQAVQNGEIIAAFYDEFEFKRYLTEHPDVSIDLQLVIIDERKDYLAIAIPPENMRMQAWLKQYFAYRKPLEIAQVLHGKSAD